MTSTTRTSESVLVVFLDLTHFALESKRAGDFAAADVIDEYYELVSRSIESTGGRVVKFIGDAALAIVPDDRIDAAVAVLLDLPGAVERLMRQRGWQCGLTVRAHFGDVIVGEFGAEGDKRFDIVGQVVNETARMTASGITFSEAALAKLSPTSRERIASRG